MIHNFRRTKNPDIKKKTKIYLIDAKYFVTMYLWKTAEKFKANLPNMGNKTRAAFCSNYYSVNISETGEVSNIKSPKFLGEFHFISNNWNTDIVFHEVQHFIIHRMRVLFPDQNLVVEQESINYDSEYTDHVKNKKGQINAEEVICYEAGRMGNLVYNWLWENDKK